MPGTKGLRRKGGWNVVIAGARGYDDLKKGMHSPGRKESYAKADLEQGAAGFLGLPVLLRRGVLRVKAADEDAAEAPAEWHGQGIPDLKLSFKE